MVKIIKYIVGFLLVVLTSNRRKSIFNEIKHDKVSIQW